MARRNKKTQTRSLENPAVPLWSPAAYNYLGAPRSSAGVAVDRFSVLGYPAVWRCVNLVSQKCARLDLNVYKKNKQGGREIDTEHPAYWLLMRKPSELYTPYVLKQALLAHALLHGNAYCWIVRDSLGVPQELLLLDPERTGIALDKGQLTYFTRIGDQETRKLLPSSVLHIKGIGHSGLIGYDVISLLRESFGLGLAAQHYGSVFFKNNGSTGPLILKFPQKLDKEQAIFIRNEWDKLHTGLDNSHRFGILSNGGDAMKFDVDNEAYQFCQTRELEVAIGICNIFGVPPHKCGVKVSTAYNSIEAEEKSFLNDCVAGWLTNIEEECEAKLLKTSQQIRDSHFIEFDRRPLEEADDERRTSILINLLNNGLIWESEAREELNRPAFPGPDKRRMPANITYTGEGEAVPDERPSQDEQPAEAPAEGPDPGQPVEDPIDPSGSPTRLHSLLTHTLRRWLQRAHKAALAASKGPGWQDWQVKGIGAHRRILCESLAGVVTDGKADALLAELQAELQAVTREQVGRVFKRQDPEDWARRLLEDK